MFRRLVLVAAGLSTRGAGADLVTTPPSKHGKMATPPVGYDASLYRRVSPVNTSECLDKVRDVPLRFYEFAYERVEGRRKMGVWVTTLNRCCRRP